MTTNFRESYHNESGLEQAVIDLVRIGSSGFSSGVRQVASRLVRTVPPGVNDPDQFRNAIHDAVAAGTSRTGLRFASGELPTADDGGMNLVDVDPFPNGDGMVLSPDVLSELREVVTERARADELAQAGVGLTKTMLFSGPPGVGKTMAARWLASQIKLPLVSLDLSAVTSSFLGHSGRNVRAVLDYAKSGDCVLLLDEFDALAKRRDDDSDIGELKRVVNVILVELDRWPQTNLLVAATNLPALLDPAVERRFDRRVQFNLPNLEERYQILQALAVLANPISLRTLEVIARACEGLNGSELVRIWNIARRRSVLNGHSVDDELLGELVWQVVTPKDLRDQLWLLTAERLGMSNRQIAVAAGVTHPTVASALERARRSNGRTTR